MANKPTIARRRVTAIETPRPTVDDKIDALILALGFSQRSLLPGQRCPDCETIAQRPDRVHLCRPGVEPGCKVGHRRGFCTC